MVTMLGCRMNRRPGLRCHDDLRMSLMDANRSHWTRTNAIIAAVGIVVAALVAIFIWRASSGSDEAPTPTPSSTSNSTALTPSAKPTPSPTPSPTTATPAPSSPTPTPTSEPAPGSEYLADLAPVAYDEPPEWDPQSINGDSYPHSVALSSGGCARNQKTQYQWVLGGDFKLLTATIGLNDNTREEPRVRVEVVADSDALFSKDMKAGDEEQVQLDLTGVKRLTLRQVYLGPEPNICSGNATAVWGDARVSS